MRAILTIPLPLFPKPDKLIWHLHKKELSGRTGVLGYNEGWNRLWSLDVPPKVRDFLCRACRGVLPTRDILSRRGIHVPAACLFCDHDESISHVFLHCPMAVELWRLAGFSTAVDFSIFMDFFIHIYNAFGREMTSRMAIHAWKLWHARNERLWVNKVLSPSEVHHAASSYFSDYVASLVSRQRMLSHPSVPHVLPLVEATTLEVEWIAFIDCAVFASADLFGFAAVFEDLEGFFSIAISGFYERGGQPVIAETLALRQCLSYARDCFLQVGCIFTDNQSLTLAIRSPLNDFSEFGLVVSDCKDVMRSHSNIHVRWVRRSENRVAPLLARESIHHGFERLSSLKKLKFLDLSYNVLNGSAMSALSNLISLKTLILNSNEMVGLCRLKRLTELDLKNNKFSGPLPQCLRNISSLQYLDLSSNQFAGNMESILSKLTSLKCLVLSGNNFEGLFSFSALANHSQLEIFELSSGSSKLEVDTQNPTWFPTFQLKLFHLSNCHLNVQTRTVPSFLLYQHDMNFIDLSHNKLTGAFPNNSKLQVMNLMNNSFTGSFQLPNFNHRDLVKLEISSNNITGQLPKEFGLVLSNLCYINMSRNSFHGNVPSSVGEIRQLRYMDLSYNNFSGVLPGSILGNGTDLYYLYLSNNNFNGIGGESSSISVELFVLDMSNNKLSDTIPLQLCNMVSLRILYLSENRLHGSLPSCFNSPWLQFLFLQKNSLSGSIPYVLSTSPSLVVLDLRDNKFTGNLPTWINQLSELRVLSLGGNPLGGHLPEQLCELRNVSILDLSRNLLSGSIPSCFNNISFGNVREHNNFEYTPKSLGDFLPFTSYYSLYDGTLEFEVEELFHMSSSKEVEVEFAMKYKYNPYKGDIVNLLAGIDLSCNELNGSIPSEFGDLHEILSLNLSQNHLSVYIPISFSNLESLESLDLSFNNLSGEIPSQLVALSFLETFCVSYNNLSGRIPDEGQCGTFDESSYRGNPGLCGPIVNRSCDAAEVPPTPPSNDKEEEEEGGVDMAWFNWSFNASYVTIVFVLMVTLSINREWRMLWFYWVDVCIYYISIQLFGTDRLCL
uniref:Reverse transcriptase zinc-binding domain-containing protein n=1 Tax=Manihot esculenta TaxID=3983 RepID=A0A199UAT7_MANES